MKWHHRDRAHSRPSTKVSGNLIPPSPTTAPVKACPHITPPPRTLCCTSLPSHCPRGGGDIRKPKVGPEVCTMVTCLSIVCNARSPGPSSYPSSGHRLRHASPGPPRRVRTQSRASLPFKVGTTHAAPSPAFPKHARGHGTPRCAGQSAGSRPCP